MKQLENFKYMICNNEKQPLHSFDEPVSYNIAKDKDNIAIKLEEPFVVIDLDNDAEFNILCQIVKDLDIKTRILKTSRGGHFWFKSIKPMKNVTHSNTPITLKIDVKSWGKNTMELIKRDGIWREWLQFDENIDVLPAFLKPIVYKKDLLHYREGDGRDSGLFTFIIPLINEELTKDEIRGTFYIINKYIFDEPLTDEEIDKMFEDNKIFESVSSIFYKGSKFQHDTFANYLIREYKIKGYAGNVYFYHNTMYTDNKDILSSKMLEVIPSLHQANIREVQENIRLKMICKNDIPSTEYINLKNGLYHIKTHKFIQHNPDVFVLNQMDCIYDTKAFNQDVYDVIRSLAVENEDIITLLVQMLGYCLLGDCRFQKSFILLGNGRNGKSMFLEMIRKWLGDVNCSSLALEDLSQKFKPAELIGKMVNIGDDSGHNLLENTAIFKKLVTGDSITIEIKNVQPFQFVNKAKMIFAANSLPPTTDKSEGFFRRCIVIPFNAIYRETDANYDPNMIDRIITESAKSYLFLLAIQGLDSLLENNMFYIPADSKSINEYYELTNNNIMMWFQSVDKPYETVKEGFTNYLLFCTNNGYRPVSVSKFQQEYVKLQKGFK